MYELEKNGKVFTSKFVGTGPSSYEKRIYRAAISRSLRNTALDHPTSNSIIFLRGNYCNLKKKQYLLRYQLLGPNRYSATLYYSALFPRGHSRDSVYEHLLCTSMSLQNHRLFCRVNL